MSALLDELHSVLTSFREHVAGLVNSGMVSTIDGHLDRLAAAAEGGVQAADDAVKGVLNDLYTAFHGSAPVSPPDSAAPVEDAVTEVPAVEAPPSIGEPTVEFPAVDTAPAADTQTPEAAV